MIKNVTRSGLAKGERRSRLMMRAAGVLAVVGLALPALAVSAPTATADPAAPSASADIPGLDARIKTKGGDLLYFDLEGGGIKMAVYDDRKDGYGVRGYAYADGVTATVYTNRGKGTHQTREFGVVDGPVKIKLCYTKKGKNVQCSKTQQARP